MLDALHIGGPYDVLGILWARDDETLLWQPPRRFEKKAVERRLAIRTIGAEIAEIPCDGFSGAT